MSVSGLLLEFHHEKHCSASTIYLENTPAMQSNMKTAQQQALLKNQTKPNPKSPKPVCQSISKCPRRVT